VLVTDGGERFVPCEIRSRERARRAGSTRSAVELAVCTGDQDAQRVLLVERAPQSLDLPRRHSQLPAVHRELGVDFALAPRALARLALRRLAIAFVLEAVDGLRSFLDLLRDRSQQRDQSDRSLFVVGIARHGSALLVDSLVGSSTRFCFLKSWCGSQATGP
jgi:hypothetical protein